MKELEWLSQVSVPESKVEKILVKLAKFEIYLNLSQKRMMVHAKSLGLKLSHWMTHESLGVWIEEAAEKTRSAA